MHIYLGYLCTRSFSFFSPLSVRSQQNGRCRANWFLPTCRSKFGMTGRFQQEKLRFQWENHRKTIENMGNMLYGGF